MKAELRHGAEFEFVTPAELREVLQEIASGWARPPQRARPISSVPLNAGGNSTRASGDATSNAGVTIPVYQIPAGYTFRLHRLTLHPDGFTFGSPYVNATGYVNIVRGNLVQDGISFASPGMPLVWSAGTADAIDFTNGEDVGLFISGGPASVTVSVRMQGTLEPIVRQ